MSRRKLTDGLTDRELLALKLIGKRGSTGTWPKELAREMTIGTGSKVSWQAAARIAGELVDLGLVKRRSYSAMTFYEIRELGRGYLDGAGLSVPRDRPAVDRTPGGVRDCCQKTR
jgi:hypothetical protein